MADDVDYYLESEDVGTLRKLIAWWRTHRKETAPIPLKQWGKVRGVPFYNDSGEKIPANAIMAISGYDTTRHIVKVKKPGTTFRQVYLVNRSSEVEVDVTGIAQDADEQAVLYDDGAGTPTLGDGWGPKPGQWSVSLNYPNTCIVAGIKDDTKKIMLATLGVIERGLGKANGTIANEGSGAISIWAGAGLWTTDITGMDPTAVNLGPPVASGDKVQWDHLNGQMVFSKVCPT